LRGVRSFATIFSVISWRFQIFMRISQGSASNVHTQRTAKAPELFDTLEQRCTNQVHQTGSKQRSRSDKWQRNRRVLEPKGVLTIYKVPVWHLVQFQCFSCPGFHQSEITAQKLCDFQPCRSHNRYLLKIKGQRHLEGGQGALRYVSPNRVNLDSGGTGFQENHSFLQQGLYF